MTDGEFRGEVGRLSAGMGATDVEIETGESAPDGQPKLIGVRLARKGVRYEMSMVRAPKFDEMSKRQIIDALKRFAAGDVPGGPTDPKDRRARAHTG